ncbi:MAG: hypothetical protein K0R50_1453 [Eubacterium sp.]|jgi:Flp pilus assembly protein TadB|nr:hypothetical protein [Eubacterium sp.]
MGKDERIADDLKIIINKIDNMDVNTPDLMSVVNFVSDEQIRTAAKNNRQLAIFSCTALAIIAALMVIYQLSALVFVIIQGLFLIVPTVLFLLMRRRRNELL